MVNLARTTLCLCAAFLLAPGAGAICKWTDRQGTTHYAESCPDEVQSSEVAIQPPPSPEQIEAGQQRAASMQQKARENKDKRIEAAGQKADREARDENAAQDGLEQCADARWKLATLRLQLPIYMDDGNEFHTNRSLHNSYYEGTRRFLDDAQRQAEIKQYELIEEKTCTEDEADIRARIVRYMEKRDQQACWRAEQQLANMRQSQTGIPSGEMRDLQQMIDTQCN